MKDFFTRYRQSQKNPIVLPAIFALLISISIVGTMKEWSNFSLGNISASVIEGVKNTPQYDADLLVERTGNDITLRIGKNAKNVESLSLAFLSDPTRFRGVSSTDSYTRIISDEPGNAKIEIMLAGKDLSAGEILTTLHADIDADTPLAPIDAKFISAWVEYSLSVKGE